METDRFTNAENVPLETLLKKKKICSIERCEPNPKLLANQVVYVAFYDERAPIFALPTEILCLIFRYMRGTRWIKLYADEETGSSMESEPNGDSEEAEASKPGRYLEESGENKLHEDSSEANEPHEVLEESKPSEGVDAMEEFLMEVVVSHVCHQWRAIALAYPDIWTSFCYSGGGRLPLDRLQAYLERSGSQSLELWLDFWGQDNACSQLTLVQETLAHVDRWRRFTIFSEYKSIIAPFLSMARPIYAPRLEHLALFPDQDALRITDDVELVEALVPMVFAKGAPNLRSVWMNGTNRQLLLPPMSNVTTLRIDSQHSHTSAPQCSWSTFLAVLSIPTLTSVSLTGTVCEQPDLEDETVASELGTITMSNLKCLHFSDENTGRFFGNLLPYLRAPLLESLTVKETWVGNDAPSKNNNSYIFPSLADLYICDVNIRSYDAILSFARLSSTARHVFVSYGDAADSLLKLLYYKASDNTVFWPNLQVLTCNLDARFTHTLDCGLDYLASFARGRPFKSFTLRMMARIIEESRKRHSNDFMEIEKYCNVEELSHDWALILGNWPAHGDDDRAANIFVERKHNPFYIDYC